MKQRSSRSQGANESPDEQRGANKFKHPNLSTQLLAHEVNA